MSHKSDLNAVPEAELRALLRRFGEEPLHEPRGQEQDDREARFAAQIDEQLSKLAAERRRSRRSRVVLVSLAAALPLGFWAARAAHRAEPVLALSREPVASAARASAPFKSVSSAPEPSPSVQALPPKSPEHAALPAPVNVARGDAGAAESGSTLGAENGLFQAAVGDAHAGNVEQALRGFEQLLHDHPQSPLAQTALVRKFRVLLAAGRISEARVEARRYLQLYPAGFGKREAEILANGQAPTGIADAGNGTESP